ncbi:hypothetical protein, conserved in T. vivax [Trypanosoma vivax Y486]|uniref:Uncharacterized protein n=1 Tax=Trypanosoma vivax (strain Y486) TaxID=1055687 RepID=F9WTS1_TRYVY|nr:hypothetical protein, conserved in T. vivax [Trypanosoma vivax Y486]|eukprot:CCD20966.1 hypothetical protein, conserved in T. vivax [Trypanosoma vivax Y486]
MCQRCSVCWRATLVIFGQPFGSFPSARVCFCPSALPRSVVLLPASDACVLRGRLSRASGAVCAYFCASAIMPPTARVLASWSFCCAFCTVRAAFVCCLLPCPRVACSSFCWPLPSAEQSAAAVLLCACCRHSCGVVVLVSPARPCFFLCSVLARSLEFSCSCSVVLCVQFRLIVVSPPIACRAFRAATCKSSLSAR